MTELKDYKVKVYGGNNEFLADYIFVNVENPYGLRDRVTDLIKRDFEYVGVEFSTLGILSFKVIELVKQEGN